MNKPSYDKLMVFLGLQYALHAKNLSRHSCACEKVSKSLLPTQRLPHQEQTKEASKMLIKYSEKCFLIIASLSCAIICFNTLLAKT